MSKGEYVRIEVVRFGLRFGGVALVTASIFVFVCACVVFYLAALVKLVDAFDPDPNLMPVGLMVGGGCLLVGLALVYVGRASHKKSATIERVRPVTRATAADIPAADSLVRASNQPLQAQETVLLRAAAQGQQTSAEQLVRPTEDIENIGKRSCR